MILPDIAEKTQDLANARDLGGGVERLGDNKAGYRLRCQRGDRLGRGHALLQTDPIRQRPRYEYDVMDRILCQRVTDIGNGGKTTVTTWRYEGPRLVAVDHPDQSERYRYDSKGRVSTKTVILALANGAHPSYTTHYSYDAQGELSSMSLPDGSMLNYKRNWQHRITALERTQAGSRWLQWLLPKQTIVKNVERDVVGLSHLTYGNGIEAYYQRSHEGTLARIVYRNPGLSSVKTRTAGMEMFLGVNPAMAKPTPPVTLSVERPALPGALGLPTDSDALVDHRYLWDLRGNLLYSQDNNSASSYAFDARDRLIAKATFPNVGFARYHYDVNGNRLLAQEGFAQHDTSSYTIKSRYASAGDHMHQDAKEAEKTATRHDASGMPELIGSRTYFWDAMGKLLQISEGTSIVARYRYNHRGERIEKIVDGKHTYYLYEDRKLVAELDGAGIIFRQYAYLSGHPIAVIDLPDNSGATNMRGTTLGHIRRKNSIQWNSWFGNSGTIFYLLSNHLGATETVTDSSGMPVWKKAYSAFGSETPASPTKQTFEMNLRLPGQYADQETGLHYNDHRYYDPRQGRYLTPDPLGLLGGSNAYLYVNGNPLKYIDPEGLVLFAFDGTGNTNDPEWLTANQSSLSNVSQLTSLYSDGNKRYITGVGTIHSDEKYGDIKPVNFTPGYIPLKPESLDMGGNYSGPARIARMVQYLNDEADLAGDDSAMDVDITGFSRGASEARDFANRIVSNTKNGIYSYKNTFGQQVCQKLNFRFMGLFDTVLSTNNSGTNYNLAIPEQFAYVAQAIALNEHRGNTGRQLPGSIGAFPLESIMGGSVAVGQTRIERGFIGSHADIGGGFSADQNQLSQVALVWMVDQAKSAGVRMSPAPATIIANPVLHDKSDNQYSTKGSPVAPGIEDRQVRYQNGTTSRQMSMENTGMTWANTQKFISYLPPDGAFFEGQIARVPRADYVTGKVDMADYLSWLNQNGYHIDMKVQ